MGLSGLLWFYFNSFVFHIDIWLINYDKALPFTVVLLMQELPPSRLSSRFTLLTDALTFTP